MKKRAVYFLIGLFLFICVLLGLLSANPVQEFDLNAYSPYLESYPGDIVLGPVATAEEAISAAKAVWMQIYGHTHHADRVSVYYDEVQSVWLLQGHNPLLSFDDGFCIVIGGEPYIIIRQDTGEVLAVWHTR